jgi:hypothetical protein
MSIGTVVAIVIAIVVIALAVAFAFKKARSRTQDLKTKFGPEYDRTLSSSGDAARAEEQLTRRQKRVEMYHLRPLRPEECERFAREWRNAQTRFVDDPREAVADADRLVGEAMTARGYRIPDLETRTEDLSVEHPQEVTHFRSAHEIAQRDAAGKAGTEDLRQGMQHYRAIFDALLDRRTNEVQEVRR